MPQPTNSLIQGAVTVQTSPLPQSSAPTQVDPCKTLPTFPLNPALVTAPVGGRLRLFRKNWEKLTQDSWILQVVSSYLPDFLTEPTLQHAPKNYQRMGLEETTAVREEVQNLLRKEAIRKVSPPSQGYYRNIFLVPKKDGGWRPVINLRSLNTHLRIPHFKMEGIQSLKDILRQGDFMAKLDLQDAHT